MHDSFADWYRVATPGTDGTLQPETLERRWKGVEAAAESLDDGQDLHLVRLLLQKAAVDGGFEASFRGPFKKEDPTFAMQGNGLELSVLSGAVAVLLMEERKPVADRAALALLCSTGLPTATERPWASVFVEEAGQYYRKRVRDLRRGEEIVVPTLETDGVNAAVEAFAQALPTSDWGGKVANTAKSAFAEMFKAVEQYSAAIDQLARQHLLRKEESDILWWMTAEYSRDLDCKMAEIKGPGACLVAGKELADIVRVPGPSPAKSFLDRVLTASGKAYGKTVELRAAVGATPREWRGALSKMPGLERVRDLCPVLGAVAASLSTDGEDEWLPAYKKAYQVEPRLKMPAPDLALQTYHECLLAQAASRL